MIDQIELNKKFSAYPRVGKARLVCVQSGTVGSMTYYIHS
jgi:hypothetical protein